MKAIAEFREALLNWYRAEARDLPWRRTKDPYKIWLSEIMLQQTRVDQGMPYYERFIARFPSVESLAQAEEEAVLKLWEGLGYYTRARNLHKAARLVVEDYDGKLPKQAKLLQLLPGIGRYSAGAIASIAFNEAAPVLDGNVKRILSRLYNLDACIDDTATEKALWNTAHSLVPNKEPGDHNQAMMELGARICIPKKPNCLECPVAAHCEAMAQGLQEKRPVRRPKKKPPHHEIVVAAIFHEGEYLLGKRLSEGLLGGLWEFPGGKVEQGESHQAALQRECAEELGVRVKVGGMVATVKHAYTHFKVTLNVYRCSITKGKPSAKSHQELRWVAPDDFNDYPFPKANLKFLNLLVNPVD